MLTSRSLSSAVGTLILAEPMTTYYLETSEPLDSGPYAGGVQGGASAPPFQFNDVHNTCIVSVTYYWPFAKSATKQACISTSH